MPINLFPMFQKLDHIILVQLRSSASSSVGLILIIS